MFMQQRGRFLTRFLMSILSVLKGLESLNEYEIVTVQETHFCSNASLEGFRLDAKILEVRNVSSKSECVDKCLADPCCRSINYEYSTSPERPNKCEFLHDLLEEHTTTVLEENASFDHVYIIHPRKPYDYTCFREILEKYASCKELFEKHSLANDGVYYLQFNKSSEIYQAYCSENTYACGEGAWTLVMKLDGNKNTFEYHSSLWENKKTLNVEGLYDDRTKHEAKLASYYNTPFTKICLGMKARDVDAEPNFIVLNYTASSLYSVIADGAYRATNASRAKWLSLVDNPSLQPHCNMEGFNVQFSTTQLFLRIGLIGNNEVNCKTPDSLLGFGFKVGKNKWSSGAFNALMKPRVNIKTFGYILVQ